MTLVIVMVILVIVMVILVIVMVDVLMCVLQCFERFDRYDIDCKPGYFDVVAASLKALDMKRKIPLTGIESKQASGFIVIVVMGLLKHDRGLFRHHLGNSTVDHVDHAANRTTAVQQTGRTSNDFDPIGKAYLDAFSVIRALVRDICCTNTVLQDTNAIARMAANDGVSNARAEGGIVDPDFLFQSLS